MLDEKEFEILKDQSYAAADNTIALAFEFAASEKVKPAIAYAHIQLIAVRLLATVLASSMTDENLSFDEAFKSLLNGLKKETRAIHNEILNGQREGIPL